MVEVGKCIEYKHNLEFKERNVDCLFSRSYQQLS